MTSLIYSDGLNLINMIIHKQRSEIERYFRILSVAIVACTQDRIWNIEFNVIRSLYSDVDDDDYDDDDDDNDDDDDDDDNYNINNKKKL